jgi:hypothetical protein
LNAKLLFLFWKQRLFCYSWNRIRCREIPCSAERGPFDHFEIRSNLNLKILTRISKWSNGSCATLHGAARQRIRFRYSWATSPSRDEGWRLEMDPTLIDWLGGANRSLYLKVSHFGSRLPHPTICLLLYYYIYTRTCYLILH